MCTILLKRNKSHEQLLLTRLLLLLKIAKTYKLVHRYTHKFRTHRAHKKHVVVVVVVVSARENLLQSIENICKNREKNEKKMERTNDTIYICTI